MTHFSIDPLADTVPLGGLEHWLHDPSVTEVMVNAGTSVWVERHGAIEHVGTTTVRHTLATLEHILVPIGRRLDRAQPWVDARLADGSRVCAIIAPLSPEKPKLVFTETEAGTQLTPAAEAESVPTKPPQREDARRGERSSAAAKPAADAAAALRLAEKRILTETMVAVRRRLAPIRGIPTKSGRMDTPNSDILEIFEQLENLNKAPRAMFNSMFGWDEDGNIKPPKSGCS